MSKRLIMFCVGLAVIALAMPVHAEVQNIKVSGDIAAYALYRNNYDLRHEELDYDDVDGDGTTTGEREFDDEDALLASVVRLRVDADLTDNVSATIALANLRDWDSESPTVNSTSIDQNDVLVNLAYVTLKEMLYSPLTLIIGRQNLGYGNGLIIGNGLYFDPDNQFAWDDLSPMHGYDAVRAILDYDPWTIDVIMAKMEESDDAAQTNRSSDEDLYGVNLAYKFDDYEAEMEGYYFVKVDETFNTRINTYDTNGEVTVDQGKSSSSRNYEESTVYALGLRGSMVPMDNLTLKGEIAGQFGEIEDETYTTADRGNADASSLSRDREALMGYVGGTYDFVDVMLEPSLSVEYLYASGEESTGDGTGDYEQWDPMYRGCTFSYIRDCLEQLFVTNDPYDTGGFTNTHMVKLSGTADFSEYIDGLKAELGWLHFWFVEEPLPGTDEDAGDELDLKVTYDYTEDVQFALLGAVFIPGEYYDHSSVAGEDTFERDEHGITTNDHLLGRTPGNDPAYSVVGSCTVAF